MFLTLDRVVAILYRSEAPLQECVVLQMTYVSGALFLYKIGQVLNLTRFVTRTG
jgi:hypothetical protein